MGQNRAALHMGLDLHPTLIHAFLGHNDFVDPRRPDDPERNVNVDYTAITPFEGGLEIIDAPNEIKRRHCSDVNVRPHLAV